MQSWAPSSTLAISSVRSQSPIDLPQTTSDRITGAIVAAGVTLGTFKMSSNWCWRLPSLLQVVPSALQIIFGYFLPESPRWLVARGRGEEAYAILAKYHAEGDVESELVKAEYVQIEKTLEAEKETAKVGWTDLLKTKGMRRRILVGSALGVFTQWSGNGLTSYVWSLTSSSNRDFSIMPP